MLGSLRRGLQEPPESHSATYGHCTTFAFPFFRCLLCGSCPRAVGRILCFVLSIGFQRISPSPWRLNCENIFFLAKEYLSGVDTSIVCLLCRRLTLAPCGGRIIARYWRHSPRRRHYSFVYQSNEIERRWTREPFKPSSLRRIQVWVDFDAA